MTFHIQAIDVGYLNLQGAANAFLIEGPSGFALVESGTAATWPALVNQLELCGVHPTQIMDLLLTHIHLDHAGAAGHFAAGDSRVWVHSFGVVHLVDPTKLLASSRRVHGEMYERFYGDLWPIPESQALAVVDGQGISAVGLEFHAIETPGHARHHHAWLLEHADQRHIFVGDALGIAVPNSDFISIPTPPPEFDPLAWKQSLRRLRDAAPTHLWLTHGGLQSSNTADALRFIDRVQARLQEECDFLQMRATKIMVSGARESSAYEHALLSAIQEYKNWLHPKAADAGVSAQHMYQFLGDYFLRMNLQGALRHASTRA
ncbi:MAG: MBL fold metallo-hydrolase [Phycisphaerales bacterium]|nr:MBL fold metallo-hydrolase [Phycisphaerales bacterium]